MDRQNLHLYSLLIITFLITLVACTPPTPPPSPTSLSSPTPISVGVTVTPIPVTEAQSSSTPTPRPTVVPTTASSNEPIIVWESLSEPQAQKLAQEIEVFQVEFPQYAVTLQHYDSPENFMAPLLADQITFDIVLASPVLLSSLWSAEQVAPMSDFFPSSFIDAFASITLLGASREGVLWGLPDTSGFHLLLFYNRDLVDTPPTNTAELLELAESLTKGSQWGLGVNSYEPLWVTPWLTPYGGWLIDEAGQPTLDSDATEDAITLYLSWLDPLTGIAPVETYDEMRKKFLNGDIAMMIDGEWAIGELSSTNDVDWGVALLPAVVQAQESQPAAPLVLGRYWAVSQTATGNRALAAATFLEFITRPERQLAWINQFGLLPTRREALNAPLIVNDPVLRVSSTQMQAGQAIPLGVNVNFLLDAMREPIRQVIDDELAPKEAAEMMQANAER